MSSRAAGTDLLNQLTTLSLIGVVGDLSDGQLLGRYLTESEGASQAAFSALVSRHGSMVLGVCRQVLSDANDADDAFQATFLALARKASSIRKPDSVASWLHGVAFRVAIRLKTNASKRKEHERSGESIRLESAYEAENAAFWSDLHEEVAQLPKRFREPVVLCYLEGLTTDVAAARLGCPKGTILSRLSRARDRLRKRLTRRGLAPDHTLALIVTKPTAFVPGSLASATVTMTALSTGGPFSAGTIPASVLSLTTGVLRAMTLAKLKFASLTAISIACVGLTASGVHAYQNRDGILKPEPKPAPTAQPEPAAQSAPSPNPSPFSRPKTDSASLPVAPATKLLTEELDKPLESPSSRELATQFLHARKLFDLRKKLHGTGAITESQFRESEASVQILEARIADRIEQLEEDLELATIRLDAKRAELAEANADTSSAQATFDAKQQMNERLKGSISQYEMTKAQAEVDRNKATVSARSAGVRELEARIRYIQKRLRPLLPLVKEPARVKEVGPT